MYKAVKKSTGSHGHPSHPKWDVVTFDVVTLECIRLGTMYNMVYADKIVKLLNEDAEKLGKGVGK